MLLLLCSTLAACTNRAIVLRPLYNGLDDRFQEEVFEHTEFDAVQTQQIKDLLDHYHVWHRQTQLDHYAVLLEDIVAQQRNAGEVTAANVDDWAERIYGHQAKLIECSPFYLAGPIISSLTDEQLSDIRDHRIKESDERRERRENRDSSGERSADGRVKTIKRYLGLIGLNLKPSQLADLKNTMESTVRPEGSFRELGLELEELLYATLEKRGEPNWDAQLVDYIDVRRQRVNDHWDTARQHNRQVWKDYALRTLNSFDTEQRQAVSKYLSGLSRSGKTLAADRPSYRSRTADEYICSGVEIG